MAQDTFYVGTLKGVGRVYQQSAIDTYSKVAFAKLYDRKTPLTSADLLNDRVVPFFESCDLVVSRVLTDRGTEYCGRPESHDYELYLAIENIDHTRTKVKSPQTNGICERFHKTVLEEFYRVAFRKKLYSGIAACSLTWMNGSGPIMRRGPIRDAGALARADANLSGCASLGEGEAECSTISVPRTILAVCASPRASKVRARRP